MTDAQQFTFTFDQARCTGCKACQIACKDDNKLPVGTSWRRVYESSGGSWPTDAQTLSPEGVFTYYTSLSCNHCTDPICVSVCPSTAMHKGDLGLVTVDAGVCIGCGYCAMACPYQAPQFRPDLGIMTKCDGCLDRVQAGEAPACAAACPTRALGFELSTDPNPLPPPLEPLPNPELTRPNLILAPHPAALRARTKDVSTVPRWQPSLSHEAPLVVFTVLAQVAAGLAVAMALAGGAALALGATVGILPILGTGLAGAILGLALAASTTHLGTPRRAPNALRNLRSSPLSREIAVASVFGLLLVILGATLLLVPTNRALHVGLAALAGAAGALLVAAIAKVYTLRTVPAWNSIHTTATFIVTAVTVGFSLGAWLLSFADAADRPVPVQLALYAVSLAAVVLGRLTRRRHLMALAQDRSDAATVSVQILTASHPRLRALGRGAEVVGAICVLSAAAAALTSLSAAPFLGAAGVVLLLVNELVGRLFFYRSMIREGR